MVLKQRTITTVRTRTRLSLRIFVYLPIALRLIKLINAVIDCKYNDDISHFFFFLIFNVIKTGFLNKIVCL